MLLTLMPIIYAYFVCLNPARAIKRGLILALVALVMTGALFFVYMDILGPLFFVYMDILGPQLGFLIEYQKPGLNRWSESYISTFLFQIHPFITAAALFAIFTAARKMDFRFLIVSFLLFLFLFLQVKRIRYTMPVFPMLALMAGYGLGEIQNKKVAKQMVLSVISTAFVVAYMGFLPFLKTLGVQNLQAAGRYVNSIPGANVEVVSFAGDTGYLHAQNACI
jgi:hypothetical protein